MSANPTDKSTNRRPRFTASKTLFNTEFHEKHIIVINCLSALLSILQQVHFLELNYYSLRSPKPTKLQMRCSTSQTQSITLH